MKGKIIKVKSKGKSKSDTEKNLEYVKRVRAIDRELAKESGEFHKWMPTSSVHKDKKKHANKNASREFKRNKGKNDY